MTFFEEKTKPTQSALSYETDRSVEAALVPGLTVLHHPRLSRIGERALLPELNGVEPIALGRHGPAFHAPGREARRRLGDPRLSRQPIHLRGDGGGGVLVEKNASPVRVEIRGQEIGAAHHVCADELRRGVVFTLGRSVVLLLHRLDPHDTESPAGYGLVGESADILRVRRLIQQVAPLEVPVLLRGESGTGKELAAQAIHRASPRRRQPFVAVNFTALPPALASAELFGAERGAFTGADRSRPGYFASAEGGTLFLDEIGDAPVDLQAMLLRVLESGEIQPLGGSRPRVADARIVAATDAELEKRVTNGEFRAPLFHRLAAFPIHLPPLRDRRDDIGRLIRHFLEAELRALGAEGRLAPERRRPWFPAPLAASLAEQDWPGNVRELRHAIRRLAILFHPLEEIPLHSWDVQALLRGSASWGASTVTDSPGIPIFQDAQAAVGRRSRPRQPTEISEEELAEALRVEKYRLQAAADRLGMPRSSLYRMIERSGTLRIAAQLDAEEIREALASHPSVEKAAEALRVSATGLRRRLQKMDLSG